MSRRRFLLKPRPRDTHLSPEAEGFWRSMGRDPRGTFGTLRYRFREIDRRIAGIERDGDQRRFQAAARLPRPRALNPARD